MNTKRWSGLGSVGGSRKGEGATCNFYYLSADASGARRSQARTAARRRKSSQCKTHAAQSARMIPVASLRQLQVAVGPAAAQMPPRSSAGPVRAWAGAANNRNRSHPVALQRGIVHFHCGSTNTCGRVSLQAPLPHVATAAAPLRARRTLRLHVSPRTSSVRCSAAPKASYNVDWGQLGGLYRNQLFILGFSIFQNTSLQVRQQESAAGTRSFCLRSTSTPSASGLAMPFFLGGGLHTDPRRLH